MPKSRDLLFRDLYVCNSIAATIFVNIIIIFLLHETIAKVNLNEGWEFEPLSSYL